MSDTDQSSRTLWAIAVIVAVTLALFGTEAWNRARKGQAGKPASAAAVTAPSTPAPSATSRAPAAQQTARPSPGDPGPGTAGYHDDIAGVE
jgi:hypothetical protein